MAETNRLQSADRQEQVTQPSQSLVLVESELNALFAAMTDVIMVVDRQGYCAKLAPTHGRSSHLSWLGKNLAMVFPAPLAHSLGAAVEQCLDQQTTVTVEYPFPNSQTWYAATLSPLSSDRVVWAARDTTTNKQTEAALRQAKEDAEVANRAKSRFVSNMSHELRTPLNAILGYSEILQEESLEWGYDELVPDLQKIQQSGKHLLSIINDILELSRLETGKMGVYIESFSVPDLIAEVVEVIQPLLQANRNELILYCSQEVKTMRSDSYKVRQSLLNLLHNATKFTCRGMVKLTVRYEENLTVVRGVVQTVPQILFSVSDSGIGMTQPQIEQLFQPFQLLDDSTTRRFGGTGLGLAITHRFCQMLGGKITVESELGKGSMFTIHLPAQVILDEAEGDQIPNR